MRVVKTVVPEEFRPIELRVVIETQGELQAMQEFCSSTIAAARACRTSTHQEIIAAFLGDVWRTIKA